MKKLLLATSILGMTAGLAAAEITLSGDARMGILDDFGATGPVFNSRARVKFTMSGESDSGFTFGADFRANDAAAAASGTAGSVFIAMGGLKLSMGDVDGAAQAAVGQTDGVGLTGLSDLNEINYLATGGSSPLLLDAGWVRTGGSIPAGVAGDETALVQYNSGAFTVYASASQLEHSPSEIVGGVVVTTWTEADALSVGASYAGGNYRLGIGYEKWDGVRPGGTAGIDNIALGADATVGPVVLKARYSEGSSEFSNVAFQDHKQWSLSATYTSGATSVTAFASELNFDTPAGANRFAQDAIGLGASYDLGGGAAVTAGIARRSTTDGAAASVDTNAADIGLSFSF